MNLNHLMNFSPLMLIFTEKSQAGPARWKYFSCWLPPSRHGPGSSGFPTLTCLLPATDLKAAKSENPGFLFSGRSKFIGGHKDFASNTKIFQQTKTEKLRGGLHSLSMFKAGGAPEVFLRIICISAPLRDSGFQGWHPY